MIVNLVKGRIPEKERKEYVESYEKVVQSMGDDLDAVENMEATAVILVSALNASGDFSAFSYKTLYEKVRNMKGDE
jgi:hypothetical protein